MSAHVCPKQHGSGICGGRLRIETDRLGRTITICDLCERQVLMALNAYREYAVCAFCENRIVVDAKHPDDLEWQIEIRDGVWLHPGCVKGWENEYPDCTCGHLRQAHDRNGCRAFIDRSQWDGRRRLIPCECGAFELPADCSRAGA